MERSMSPNALSPPGLGGGGRRRLGKSGLLRLRPTILVAGTALLGIAILALLAPAILSDPRILDPTHRLESPGAGHVFGTDNLGRSVFVRTVYGTRVSLAIGLMVAFATTIPVEALTSRLNWVTLLAAFAAAVVLFVASRAFWKFGLRHYSGASA